MYSCMYMGFVSEINLFVFVNKSLKPNLFPGRCYSMEGSFRECFVVVRFILCIQANCVERSG